MNPTQFKRVTRSDGSVAKSRAAATDCQPIISGAAELTIRTLSHRRSLFTALDLVLTISNISPWQSPNSSNSRSFSAPHYPNPVDLIPASAGSLVARLRSISARPRQSPRVPEVPNPLTAGVQSETGASSPIWPKSAALETRHSQQ